VLGLPATERAGVLLKKVVKVRSEQALKCDQFGVRYCRNAFPNDRLLNDHGLQCSAVRGVLHNLVLRL
jgi:hypothetical protein